MDPGILSKAQFLKDQLEKPRSESKKWRMTIIGLWGVGGMFFMGMVGFFIHPALAPHIATLVQFAMTAWGGIVGLFLGAQGSVEYKTTAALENTHKEETITEHKIDEKHYIVEGEPGAPERRPWSLHDESEDEAEA